MRADLAWAGFFFFLILFLRDAGSAFWRLGSPWISASARERRGLVRVISSLHEFQETFEAGLVPTPEKWEGLHELPSPWGELAHQSLKELRARGGAILPTLRRMRALVERHSAALAEARARSAQALAQALACGLLVPLFGAVLYLLLPGVDQRPWSWCLLCGTALFLSGCGALWLLKLADRARWGGLSGDERVWVLSAQCAGERLLSLIRCGNPPDLAWTESIRFLAQESPGLARAWGFQVYESAASDESSSAHPARSCRAALVEAGVSIRRAIQVSLMEGRPCTERVESVLAALRQQVAAGIERELSLLGTRALQPLFVCVAPALFGLLGSGLYLTWKAAAL